MRRKLFSDRRKLFSNSVTRRKLFSHSIEEMYPSDEKEVMCMDCRNVFKTYGYTTNLLCPNCGSKRFEFVENITNDMAPENENPSDVAFSDVRRRLFSDDCNPLTESPARGSALTNINPGRDNEPLEYICPDCGSKFTPSDGKVICPVCGGSRSIVNMDQDQSEFSEDSEVNKELDEFLSNHKGQTIKSDDADAELYARGIYDEVGGVEGLVDQGLASEDRYGQVTFSELADSQMRLFSKLVISVTREFDIDPVLDRESVIDSLSERMPEKGMIILKKCHTLRPESVSFSDKSYLKDSGIEGDLSLEYGGTTMSLKEFMKMLSEEYPDAPDDIIEQLESSKTIKVNGGKVLIQ